MLLYNIIPFWLLSFVHAEYYVDDQQTRLYMEAMQGATISEVLGYLMAVGLHTVYKGHSGLLQKLVFDRGILSFFSFLVYAQNQKNWLQAILYTLDPAGPLQLKSNWNTTSRPSSRGSTPPGSTLQEYCILWMRTLLSTENPTTSQVS